MSITFETDRYLNRSVFYAFIELKYYFFTKKVEFFSKNLLHVGYFFAILKLGF